MDSETSTISVPVKTKLFLEVVDCLREYGSDRDPVEAIELAIGNWLECAHQDPEGWMPEIVERPQHLGYMWKNLHLPPGTKIRMIYKNTAYHASVEGDDFIYEGEKTSPSEFANRVANGTARNAWRDLWIKRPNERDFRLADEIRKSGTPYSARELGFR